MDPFIGEIRAVGFNFPPVGWAVCDGSLLSIAQNTALFSLLGTTYGGDGQTTFGLPDLRGRASIGQGQGPGTSNYVMGQIGGSESVTLTSGTMPSHTHAFNVTTNAPESTNPADGTFADLPAGSRAENLYAATSDSQALAGAISVSGGGVPHENRQPYECVLFIIALEGIFPPRN